MQNVYKPADGLSAIRKYVSLSPSLTLSPSTSPSFSLSLYLSLSCYVPFAPFFALYLILHYFFAILIPIFIECPVLTVSLDITVVNWSVLNFKRTNKIQSLKGENKNKLYNFYRPYKTVRIIMVHFVTFYHQKGDHRKPLNFRFISSLRIRLFVFIRRLKLNCLL
jgi:hypothetical protein